MSPHIDPLSDAKVLDSWHKNAMPWTTAVRDRQIESRRLVTDQAVVDAVLSLAPLTVLDIGCGEGWLVRALAERGVVATGVDAVPELVTQAQAAGGGEFFCATYDELTTARLTSRFDAVVANFSFIGAGAVEALIHRLPGWLNPSGALVIQTLHPSVSCGDQPYVDGWRPGSWAGFSAHFVDPAPWYFRTMQSWFTLLAGAGLGRIQMREPVHPVSGRPSSLVLVARPG